MSSSSKPSDHYLSSRRVSVPSFAALDIPAIRRRSHVRTVLSVGDESDEQFPSDSSRYGSTFTFGQFTPSGVRPDNIDSETMKYTLGHSTASSSLVSLSSSSRTSRFSTRLRILYYSFFEALYSINSVHSSFHRFVMPLATIWLYFQFLIISIDAPHLTPSHSSWMRYVAALTNPFGYFVETIPDSALIPYVTLFSLFGLLLVSCWTFFLLSVFGFVQSDYYHYGLSLFLRIESTVLLIPSLRTFLAPLRFSINTIEGEPLLILPEFSSRSLLEFPMTIFFFLGIAFSILLIILSSIDYLFHRDSLRVPGGVGQYVTSKTSSQSTTFFLLFQFFFLVFFEIMFWNHGEENFGMSEIGRWISLFSFFFCVIFSIFLIRFVPYYCMWMGIILGGCIGGLTGSHLVRFIQSFAPGENWTFGCYVLIGFGALVVIIGVSLRYYSIFYFCKKNPFRSFFVCSSPQDVAFVGYLVKNAPLHFQFFIDEVHPNNKTILLLFILSYLQQQDKLKSGEKSRGLGTVNLHLVSQILKQSKVLASVKRDPLLWTQFLQYFIQEKIEEVRLAGRSASDMSLARVIRDITRIEKRLKYLLLIFWSKLIRNVTHDDGDVTLLSSKKKLSLDQFLPLVTQIEFCFQMLDSKFRATLRRHSSTPVVLKRYGTFLREVCCEPHLASYYLHRARELDRLALRLENLAPDSGRSPQRRTITRRGIKRRRRRRRGTDDEGSSSVWETDGDDEEPMSSILPSEEDCFACSPPDTDNDDDEEARAKNWKGKGRSTARQRKSKANSLRESVTKALSSRRDRRTESLRSLKEKISERSFPLLFVLKCLLWCTVLIAALTCVFHLIVFQFETSAQMNVMTGASLISKTRRGVVIVSSKMQLVGQNGSSSLTVNQTELDASIVAMTDEIISNTERLYALLPTDMKRVWGDKRVNLSFVDLSNGTFRLSATLFDHLEFFRHRCVHVLGSSVSEERFDNAILYVSHASPFIGLLLEEMAWDIINPRVTVSEVFLLAVPFVLLGCLVILSIFILILRFRFLRIAKLLLLIPVGAVQDIAQMYRKTAVGSDDQTQLQSSIYGSVLGSLFTYVTVLIVLGALVLGGVSGLFYFSWTEISTRDMQLAYVYEVQVEIDTVRARAEDFHSSPKDASVAASALLRALDKVELSSSVFRFGLPERDLPAALEWDEFKTAYETPACSNQSSYECYSLSKLLSSYEFLVHEILALPNDKTILHELYAVASHLSVRYIAILHLYETSLTSLLFLVEVTTWIATLLSLPVIAGSLLVTAYKYPEMIRNAFLRVYRMFLSLPKTVLFSSSIYHLLSKDSRLADVWNQRAKEMTVETHKALELSGYGVIFFSSTFRVIRFNRKAEEYFTGLKDVMETRLLTSFFTEDSRMKFVNAMRSRRRNVGISFELELEAVISDHHFPISVSVSGVGRTNLFVAIVRNMEMESKKMALLRKELFMEHVGKIMANVLPEKLVSSLDVSSFVQGGLLDHLTHDFCSSHKEVTCVFADICNFTGLSSKMSSEELVRMLHALFSLYDCICEAQTDVEKIKTIGDCFFACSGVPEYVPGHANAALIFGLSVLVATRLYALTCDSFDLQIKVGLNSGPVTSGILGVHKVAYDVLGDTVNVAERMQELAGPNQIHLSRTTYLYLFERYTFVERTSQVKGRGMMKTYILAGLQLDSVVEEIHCSGSWPSSSKEQALLVDELIRPKSKDNTSSRSPLRSAIFVGTPVAFSEDQDHHDRRDSDMLRNSVSTAPEDVVVIVGEREEDDRRSEEEAEVCFDDIVVLVDSEEEEEGEAVEVGAEEMEGEEED